MSRTPEERVEAKVMDAARNTQYPPTPDIAGLVMRRIDRRRPPVSTAFARAAAILVLVMAALFLTVPDVRAAVLSLLRVGSVTLLRETPTAALTPDQVQTLLMLDGRTTLEAARSSLPFDIKLPAHPPDLGPPDHVFMSGAGAAVLVWTEGESVTLVLTMHTPDRAVFKYYPWTETGAQVNGEYAVWLTEPHTLFEPEGDILMRRIIHDHVLIWYDDVVTYRLETDLPMAEAVKLAESLK